ncbi:MAG: hypothetical protein FJ096_17090, partial [Deltaproteobacteria bacterium]|nr:hypothetical protein [Deltaproteobacteria bacterium]
TPFDARGNYLALALRPEWPSSADEAPRALALVVDASRSMLGENHRRAADLATQIVRELDVRDRFTVLACDVTCRSLGAPRHPDSTSESAIREFLRASPPAGASDVAAAVVEGARAVAGVPGFTGKVFFLGDGTPTVGPLRPATLAAALRDGVPSGVTVSGVAIGAEADRESLGALARAGRGVVIGYEPGRGSDEVAVAVLAAAGGGELTDVNVELPEGLVDAAPRELGTISPGAELLVAARMVQPTVSGIVRLSGRVGGVPFEQRYPIDVEARSDAGNAFVPRVYAGLRIRDLERRGTAEARGQAVALSSRFDVASRYTSLLVLESPAMFRAFGLDNRRLAPDWTGEVDALGSTRGSAAEEEARRNEAAQGPTLAEPEAGGDAYLDAPAPAATFGAPAAAAPRPATAPSASDGANAKKSAARAETVDDGGFAEPPLDAADPGRPVRRRRPPMPIATQPSFENLVPMKVVWEREVAFVPGTQGERDASGLAALEDELARDPNRREVVKKLVARYLRSGNLERAETLVGRWLDKEPLDDEGLLARAEITAARGNREAALRDLQSVIEARPGDGDRILGLARALQLVGDSVGACRHLVAAAELRHKDAGVLGDAVRCVREGGSSSLATALLDGVDDDLRRRVSDAPVTTFPPATGELRLDATWTGDGELDLVLVDPDGRGISWLDAPGKLIVRAADVASTTRETLALTGAKAGEYALQVRRARGRGVLRGEVAIAGPNGLSRRVPFTLEADAASLGTLQFRWRRKLVPVDALRPRPVW